MTSQPTTAELTAKALTWVASEAGQAALEEFARKAQKTSDAFNAARVIPLQTRLEPTTI